MYEPKPIETSGVELPEDINALTEKLAASTHDVWALGKFKNNITDHPDLIPYEELSEEKKDYDRNTAMETLKAIYALGYKIIPA